MANDDIDVQFTFQAGLYELTRVRNPKIISFKDEPFGLDPNGCMISMTMNNKVEPFDDPAVRRALNYSPSTSSPSTTSRLRVPRIMWGCLSRLRSQVRRNITRRFRISSMPTALKPTTQKKPPRSWKPLATPKTKQGFWTDADGEVLNIELWNPAPGYFIMSRIRHSGC